MIKLFIVFMLGALVGMVTVVVAVAIGNAERRGK